LKIRLLRELREKLGWEVDGLRIRRAKHPDGRLLELKEYICQYGVEPGSYATCLPRLIPKRPSDREGRPD